ncbi:hypothetical protein GCM10010300_77480 [Streptomyces olivaceoviridis]|nr:hypothetical protein GCM10010300_77480 [Streptomyces olivaceoviridis]
MAKLAGRFLAPDETLAPDPEPVASEAFTVPAPCHGVRGRASGAPSGVTTACLVTVRKLRRGTPLTCGSMS